MAEDLEASKLILLDPVPLALLPPNVSFALSLTHNAPELVNSSAPVSISGSSVEVIFPVMFGNPASTICPGVLSALRYRPFKFGSVALPI